MRKPVTACAVALAALLLIPAGASASRNLYTGNYTGSVGTFAIDNATGTLSPATASIVAPRLRSPTSAIQLGAHG